MVSLNRFLMIEKPAERLEGGGEAEAEARLSPLCSVSPHSRGGGASGLEIHQLCSLQRAVMDS